MKCPLIKVSEWELGHQPVFAFGDCLKEECAWWDKIFGQCIELTKTHELRIIAVEMAELRRMAVGAAEPTE